MLWCTTKEDYCRYPLVKPKITRVAILTQTVNTDPVYFLKVIAVNAILNDLYPGIKTSAALSESGR
jgi:hypothetical protein